MLTGWSTTDVVDEESLGGGGTFVAIIGTRTYTTVLGGTNTVLHAIPMAHVRQGLTRAQLQELLEQKKRHLEP